MGVHKNCAPELQEPEETGKEGVISWKKAENIKTQ